MALRTNVTRLAGAAGCILFSLAIALLAACGGEDEQPGTEGGPAQQIRGDSIQPESTPERVVGTPCTPHGAASRLGLQEEREQFTRSFGDEPDEVLYNDCQRLIKAGPGGLEYGPLAMILSYSRVLDTLSVARLAVAEVLVAAIAIDAVEGDPSYPSLRLQGGLNCAYLTEMGGARHVIMEHTTAGFCNPNGSSGGPHLTVSTAPNQDPVEIPSTARWEEGSTASQVQAYFGMKCPDGWCEVGPTSLASREPPIGNPPADPVQRRVKGWYDRQFLADIGPTGPFRSAVNGSIVPHEQLGSYTPGQFKSGWRTVAFVELDGTIAKYQNDYGMIMGRNELQLMIDPTNNWVARVIDPNGAIFTQLKVVQAHKHTDLIPAARWGWSDDDEVMWIRCLEGCCEVSNEFS